MVSLKSFKDLNIEQNMVNTSSSKIYIYSSRSSVIQANSVCYNVWQTDKIEYDTYFEGMISFLI